MVAVLMAILFFLPNTSNSPVTTSIPAATFIGILLEANKMEKP